MRSMAAAFVLVMATTGCDSGPETAGSSAAQARAETQSSPADWRARVAGDLARLRDARPEFTATLLGLSPRTTRAGQLRFTTAEVHDPDAATILLHRLTTEPSPAVREALAEALPRTEGRFGDAIVELASTDPDDGVRAVMMSIGRRLPIAAETALVQVGLGDRAPRVRAEAVRTVARHPDGASLTGRLAPLLGDPDATVRAATVHAMGALDAVDDRTLSTLLSDSDGEVRLAALRALRRADPSAAKATAARMQLGDDPDPRVREAAGRLATQAL